MKPLADWRACALAGLLHIVMVPNAMAADSPTPSPRLSAALDAAWQRSLSLASTEGLRQRAQAELGIASRPWAAAPQLELSQRSDRWHRDRGARETELSLGVPLWLYGQREAQRAAAAGLTELADAEQAAARLQLAGQLREQAWTLRRLHAAWRQAESESQTLDKMAADVARRVKAGDLADTDGMAARADALAAAAQVRQSHLALQQGRQQWRLLTGQEIEADVDESVDDAAQLTDAHPLLRRAEARVVQAHTQLELQRRSSRDAPELRLGWRQEQAARGAERDGSLVVGLRFPLEAERRNPVQLAEAAAALNVAEIERARLREQLDIELHAARESLKAAQLQVQGSSEQARLLRERATLLQRSFEAGETALPELLRALAAAAQADARLHQSQADLGLAQARLKQSLGLLP